MTKPTSYDELFPGRFLKAGLFQREFGTERPTVTITDVDAEMLPQDDGKEKTRGILTLHESKMQIALNKTNGESIKAMFGSAVRDWIGKRITLCVEKDRDPGKKGGTCDCIRVYGSPDIESDMTVSIQLPKRKPKDRKLAKTGQAQAKQPPTDKQRGNLETALANVAAGLPDVVDWLKQFSWTPEEREQIGAALKSAK